LTLRSDLQDRTLPNNPGYISIENAIEVAENRELELVKAGDRLVSELRTDFRNPQIMVDRVEKAILDFYRVAHLS
jgi:hypothetical protein